MDVYFLYAAGSEAFFYIMNDIPANCKDIFSSSVVDGMAVVARLSSSRYNITV